MTDRPETSAQWPKEGSWQAQERVHKDSVPSQGAGPGLSTQEASALAVRRADPDSRLGDGSLVSGGWQLLREFLCLLLHGQAPWSSLLYSM